MPMRMFAPIPWSAGPLLYVVGFSNGAIKVGRTSYAGQRMYSVLSSARKLFGDVYPSAVYLSEEHKRAVILGAEYRLIRFMERNGTPVPGTQEFFTGADYIAATEYVQVALRDSLSTERSIRRVQNRLAKVQAA